MIKHGDKWTIPELEILENNYPIKTKEELSKLLPNRCDSGIRMKAIRIGLKKKK